MFLFSVGAVARFRPFPRPPAGRTLMAVPTAVEPKFALNKKKGSHSHIRLKVDNINPRIIFVTLDGNLSAHWTVDNNYNRLIGNAPPYDLIVRLIGVDAVPTESLEEIDSGELTLTVTSDGGSSTPPLPVPITAFHEDRP